MERERVRAGKAEARCEDLRWREVEARSRANRLQAILDRNRAKPDAARADIREVRRKAKRALALEGEVTRPGRLLAAAGVDPRRRSPVVSPRRENAALKARVREPEDRAGARGAERGASLEPIIEVNLWPQEREEVEAVVGPQARSAIRRARPWPHEAAEARGEGAATAAAVFRHGLRDRRVGAGAARALRVPAESTLVVFVGIA